MQFGLCSISNTGTSVHSVLDAAAEAGYDGVEVWGHDHVGDKSGETCRTIRRQATTRRLDLPVYGSYLRAGTGSFDEDLHRELAVAEELDADLIRVWAGNQEYDDHDPEHWHRVVDDMERLTEAADSRGIDVTVEKHAGTLTTTAAGASRLVKAVDSPRFGVNWQPSFWLSSAELVEEAAALAPLSNNVHLLATAERGGERYCSLAEAYFDVGAILQVFGDAGFDGYANVEFVPADCSYRTAIRNELQYLRSVAR